MTFLDPRVWLAILLAIAIGAFPAYLGGRSDGRKLERADYQDAEIKATAQRLAENAAQAAQQAETVNKVRKGYTDEISRLRDSYADAGKLRVKVQCPAATLSGAPESAIGVDAGTAVELPAAVTSGLYGIAEDADKQAAQLRALQDFIRKNGVE